MGSAHPASLPVDHGLQCVQTELAEGCKGTCGVRRDPVDRVAQEHLQRGNRTRVPEVAESTGRNRPHADRASRNRGFEQRGEGGLRANLPECPCGADADLFRGILPQAALDSPGRTNGTGKAKDLYGDRPHQFVRDGEGRDQRGLRSGTQAQQCLTDYARRDRCPLDAVEQRRGTTRVAAATQRPRRYLTYLRVPVAEQTDEVVGHFWVLEPAKNLRGASSADGAWPTHAAPGLFHRALPLCHLAECVVGVPAQLAQQLGHRRLQGAPCPLVDLQQIVQQVASHEGIVLREDAQQGGAKWRHDSVTARTCTQSSGSGGHNGDSQDDKECCYREQCQPERRRRRHADALASTACTRLTSSRGLKGLTT